MSRSLLGGRVHQQRTGMLTLNLMVDPVDDLCLTNQIYSVLLNAFEFKEITEVQNAHLKCF